ncbi:MAG: LTA synthase family protein [Oscillospiraceae bacterium]|nr:LTA synthase family protein [Oscillospiraceae bacterium]
MTKRGYSKKEKTAAMFLFLADVLIFLAAFLGHTYVQVDFDQLLFQLKTTSTGVPRALLGSAVMQVGVFSLVLYGLEIWLYSSLTGKHDLFFIKKNILSFSLTAFVVSLLICGATVHIFPFVKAEFKESDFIQSHYVKPEENILHFPEKKRNLIYIFLESMESTFTDASAGEMITGCYIPELAALAEKNTNFSHNEGIGGALSYPGTTWTAAAMVTQTAGVPVKVSLQADTYGAGDVFLPGVVSIGQILEEQGYKQVLLLGSNAEFHGREVYFTEHGNYEILDTDALKEAKRLPGDYEAWWGFEDEKLFAYAKEELTRLAEAEEPFNLTMLTADTHFPDGCPCRLCEERYDIPYANVLACSSRQVADFIAWIQEQPFYENTTIVISGDHLTMDGGFMEDIDPDYIRTVYNCVIHAPEKPVREKNRMFGTMDLFPTTLAALGVKIDGEQLGLGTNLFSDRETLTEQYGYTFLAEELQKQSAFYDSEFLLLQK